MLWESGIAERKITHSNKKEKMNKVFNYLLIYPESGEEEEDWGLMEKF